MESATASPLVSPAGALVGAAPIPVFHTVVSADQNSGYPAIASDGNQFLVTYLDNRNSGTGPTDLRVSASRITAAGVLLDGTADAPGIAVTNATGVSEWPPAAAYYGGLFRLLWGQYGVALSPIVLTGGSVTPGGKVANSGGWSALQTTAVAPA